MKYTVYDGKEPVGDLTVEARGLYYVLHCKIQAGKELRRLYGLSGTESTLLGLPDQKGEFTRRISGRQFSAPERVILSPVEPGKWYPWSGDHFGPMLYDCLLSPGENGWRLAIRPEEWKGLSQWRTEGSRESVAGKEWICIDIADGESFLPREEETEQEEPQSDEQGKEQQCPGEEGERVLRPQEESRENPQEKLQDPSPGMEADTEAMAGYAHGDGMDVDPLLLAGLPADYDYGGTGPEDLPAMGDT